MAKGADIVLNALNFGKRAIRSTPDSKLLETYLQSNNPISSVNKVYRASTRGGHLTGALGGIGATARNLGQGMRPLDAISFAHKTSGGGLNYAAVAGSYIGVSTAARIAGGGGAYRDRRGNTNAIGIPFV